MIARVAAGSGELDSARPEHGAKTGQDNHMKSKDSGCCALSVKGTSISQEDVESAVLSM